MFASETNTEALKRTGQTNGTLFWRFADGFVHRFATWHKCSGNANGPITCVLRMCVMCRRRALAPLGGERVLCFGPLPSSLPITPPHESPRPASLSLPTSDRRYLPPLKILLKRQRLRRNRHTSPALPSPLPPPPPHGRTLRITAVHALKPCKIGERENHS